jgi:hypothetical protein
LKQQISKIYENNGNIFDEDYLGSEAFINKIGKEAFLNIILYTKKIDRKCAQKSKMR